MRKIKPARIIYTFQGIFKFNGKKQNQNTAMQKNPATTTKNKQSKQTKPNQPTPQNNNTTKPYISLSVVQRLES